MCVQGDLGRDSDDLVTPFMRVVIQTTRYFARLVTVFLSENGHTFLHVSYHR